MSRSKKLYDLQVTDRQIDRHHTRLEEIAAILADDGAVKKAQAGAQAAQANFDEVQQALRQAEENVASQRAKIKQSENDLYSGKISNPKELSDIQQEVAALKRYLDMLEERQIEAMFEADEAEEQLDGAQATLNAALAESEQRNAKLIQERAEIEHSLGDLDTQRQESTTLVEQADLKQYESIRAQRAGVAVAKVQDRTCSACGSTLASATHQQARSPSKIILCDTCGRILWGE